MSIKEIAKKSIVPVSSAIVGGLILELLNSNYEQGFNLKKIFWMLDRTFENNKLKIEKVFKTKLKH